MSPHVAVQEVIIRDGIIKELRAKLAAVEAERDACAEDSRRDRERVARLVEALARCREVLRTSEKWARKVYLCPCCSPEADSVMTKHAPDCALAAALGE